MNHPFADWLRTGMDNGWVSDICCMTHDMVELTPEEEQELNQGYDPCITVIRVRDF